MAIRQIKSWKATGSDNIPVETLKQHQPTLAKEPLEKVETSKYVGSIIDEQRGCDAGVRTRIGKARTAFLVEEHMELKLSSNIKDTPDPLVGYHQQQPTMAGNKSASRSKGNYENTLELDRVYIVEIIKLHHQACALNTEGERKRGRQECTLRRELEANMKKMNSNWKRLLRTDFDEKCWWTVYAPPRGVTGVKRKYTIEEHLELKTTFNQYQSQNLQYKRQGSSTVRSSNLEKYNNRHQEGTSIYKQLSTQDPQHQLAGYHHQHLTMKEKKPAYS
ncbi:unnamed protein product [Schistosoma mattheei]|uniref:Uncharacterized protein n=1 Tax=Schistosoma mattheei TaxID=31246 RepID=A0A183NYZ4_9TREM|nr:unnamed protein product [Schistosoma mattheei]